ncbi:MAG: Gfo/Idh/MocA family protein [Kiritimatiellia bacterium]
MQKVQVGVVGCGNISKAYFTASGMFRHIEIAACADLDPARAQARAEEFNVPRACSLKELLADPGIELVVNLTIPRAHAEVALQAMEAGKQVYGEKPLAVTREEGRRMLETAEQQGVRIGSAPDTFLGGGLQTCRKLIDDGWIGRPVAATAFMLARGHEHWHPQPEFYYDVGGGPMLDMGPYYLTALVNLLGPVRRVSGMTAKAQKERMITSQPQYGKIMPVLVPTHYASVLEFTQGAICSMIMSFDCQGTQLPRMEIYGTEGTLSVPDPNTFGGPVRIRRAGAKDWSDIPLTHGYIENSRGLGAAEMAWAMRRQRPHRAAGDLAFHVLDIMEAAAEAGALQRTVEMQSGCERPAPLPSGLRPGELENAEAGLDRAG